MLVKFLIIILYLFSTFLVMLGLYGLWVMGLINLIYYLLSKNIPFWVVILSFSLALIAELLDYIYTIWGAKKGKASGFSIVLSILLSIVLGLFINKFIPIIGALIGTFVGTFIGCFIGETVIYKKNTKQSFTASKGAMIGKILSVFTKLFFAYTLIIVFLIVSFF